MDFFEVAGNRFSYRKKLNAAAPPLDDLRKIVQAGVDAPSGKNAQTTGFLIIADPDVVKKINTMPGGNEAMSTAPAFIACHVDRVPNKSNLDYEFVVEDCAAAAENILLGATALGYAAVWIDGWLRTGNRADAISELCSLDSERVIRILIPVGKPLEEHPRREKKSFNERVRII